MYLRVSSGSLLACLLLGVSAPALNAQTTLPSPPPPTTPPPSSGAPDMGEGEDEADIVVTGQRERGAVLGDIKPEIQLSPADVRSYGVSSISDLLDELAPQTRSDRGSGGAPVVLLNGRRISGFSEIRDIPTEAIQRVEILPEEVSLKYGYRADQRVVNIVLRRRFRAVTVEANGSSTTEGGGTAGTGDVNLLHLRGDQRFNLSVKYNKADSLLESQRDLISRSSGSLYDFTGNIGPSATSTNGEIDPALSALVGRPVTSAGVPASAATGAPGLASFVATANTPNVSDLSRYRTLVPASDNFTANAVLSRPIFGNVNATLNTSVGVTSSDSFNGLPGVALGLPAGNPFSPFGTDTIVYRYPTGVQPLTQSIQGQTGHVGLTFNGVVKHWQWSLTGTYDYANTRTITDRGVDVSAMQALLDANSASFNPFAPLPLGLLVGLPADHARSTSNTGDITLVVNGALFKLPAGDVSTSIKIGGDALGFDARSVRSGVVTGSNLSRESGSAQVSFDLPVTSRTRGVLPFLGQLTLNANAAVDQLSDFGTLKTLGYGFNWSPVSPLSFIVSVTVTDGAPTVNQLGDPTVTTPQVRVFDYVRGTTVDVTQISGGNPDLLASNRHVLKLGLTYKPLKKGDLTLSANFIKSRIRDQTASLPSATAEIEAAFPDRFIRDADGDLIRIDSRPVNFERASSSELRWGFNFSKPLKTSAKIVAAMQDMFRQRREAEEAARAASGNSGGGPGAGGPPRDGGPGAGGPGGGGPGGFGGRGPGGGGGGGFGGRGGGQGGGRLQFSLYHTWHFSDEVLIRDGLPVLDLLNGDTIGARGGQSRHEIEAVAGYSKDFYGLRLNADWQSATTVRNGSSAGNLRFSDLATANLRLFVNLGQIPSLVRNRWAQGTRITLAVNNLFDSKIHVRDATGAVPISYQPDYLDPSGRVIRISVRKLFF